MIPSFFFLNVIPSLLWRPIESVGALQPFDVLTSDNLSMIFMKPFTIASLKP